MIYCVPKISFLAPHMPLHHASRQRLNFFFILLPELRAKIAAAGGGRPRSMAEDLQKRDAVKAEKAAKARESTSLAFRYAHVGGPHESCYQSGGTRT